jgi:uncharacterized protein
MSTQQQTQSKDTVPSRELVQRFFAAFGQGDVKAISNLFHPNAEVVAVRRGARTQGKVHGEYRGKAGVTEFIGNIVSAFDTKAFAVEHVVGEGLVAFANGSFSHRVRATDRLFNSDWALMCQIEADKIRLFHFYEDSAALVAADPATAP